MPELPEVEVMRKYFEFAALNKNISEVEIYDAKILKGDIRTFNHTLRNKHFIQTSRRGKYLFVQTEQFASALHFGMTGDLQLTSKNEEQPRFSRLAFRFKDGERLHVLSMRKFGYVKPINSIDDFIEEKSLGPDALGIKQEDFLKMLDNRKTMLKPFLMNQKNIAGVGNWIADELLHRCEIHPEKQINTLGQAEKKSLHRELSKILQAAIRFKTNKGNFPKKWFVNQRSLNGNCTRCEGDISHLKVGGRSSYICLVCQRV